MINRKLVRPNLAQIKSRMGAANGGANGAAQDVAPRNDAANQANASRRRPAPTDATNAEAFYYLKQMNTQTPMILVLDNGEQLNGHLEWYDRNCLKVNRADGPNLLVFKHCIRYLYKAEDLETLDDA